MIRLKNRDEIQRIREASLILIDTFDELKKMIAPGITTGELDRFACDFIGKRGGSPAFLGYMDYTAGLCTSVNHEVIHGIPNNIPLKEGDILSLDCGVNLKGYISDAAATFPIGKISDDAARLMKVTEECLYLAIDQVKTGNRIRHISSAVYNHARNNGYGVVHQFCGHGVGFELHEEPQIPNYISSGPNPRMKNGMVFAIEPMINEGTGDIVILDDGWTVETGDGQLSAHFEHTVALVDDLPEILTSRDNYR
jgi:methionyl aminopeptidase